MRPPALSRLLAIVVPLATTPVLAQTDGWRAYPAYNEIEAIATAPDGVWAATTLGVFFYAVPDGEIVTYTPVDGLRGGPVGSMAYDEARGVLWIGYRDGLLERLDPEAGTVTPFYAIARADQYPSRGIRRARLAGDRLYLATDFGVVVFDADREEVRNTFARIGDLESGAAVNDVLEAPRPDGTDGLWLATVGGLYHADRGATDLQTPAAWTRAPGLGGEAFSLALFDGAIYAGGGPDGAQDVYRRRADGTWERQLFSNTPMRKLVSDGEALFTVSQFFAFEIRPGQSPVRYFPRESTALVDIAVGPAGGLWLGDRSDGLLPVPAEAPVDNVVAFDPAPVVPSGPATKNIADLDVGPDGVLWAVTRQIEQSPASAISRLGEAGWTSYLTDDPDLDIARSPFLAATVGPDGTLYAGSGARGLTVVSPDGATLTTYTSANSSLTGIEGDPAFQPVRGVAFEDGTRWVVNVGTRKLHVFEEDGSWTALPLPAGPDRIPQGGEFLRVAIDEFGQKWIAVRRQGVAVWNTGDDPTTVADDQALFFSGSTVAGVGLPDPDVSDVVVDLAGRVWIGTARGIAYVFSPGSAFGGDRSLVTPQWARTADGTSYLLRDVSVNDLEVDPGGQIWVATTTGAYLINAEGNAVVREVRSGGTPLPSDEVLAIAVDPTSGRVFLTTPEGLFSFAGDTRRRQPDSEALRAIPSPYRPAEAPSGVVVSGLSAPASSVRVLTVSGEVVHAAEVTGGAFRWDGRDDRTGRLVPSGVYIVAAAGTDGSTLYGKVAVIR